MLAAFIEPITHLHAASATSEAISNTMTQALDRMDLMARPEILLDALDSMLCGSWLAFI